ncbi:hypothetical protein [uncultured Ruminococcus sp.]|uniref:gp33 family protein n=1 Tax=Ruminococcus callidus TaxID=40519 RepID=UPI00267197D7|nr:hypothetical protein [uncultured Ruminococcus sp.]
MQTQNMYELAEQLKQLREKKKAAEQQLKDIHAEIAQTEYQLSVQMAETETQNFTRAGTMFALTTKTRASAMAGRKDELYAALKENGYGDLVYETVNANSLSAFVKEQIAENQDTIPDWLNGLVHVYEQTSVSVRQSAK